LGTLITLIGVALPAALVASKVGLIALAVGGFALFLKAAHDADKGVAAFNKELERTRDLTKQMNVLRGKQFENVFADAAGMSNVGERKEFLTDQLKQAQKEVGGLVNQFVQAQFKLKKEERFFGGIGFLQTKEFVAQQERIKEIGVSLEAQRGFVKRLKSEIAGIGEVSTGGGGIARGGFGGRIDELFGSLKRQAGILKEKHAIDSYAKSLEKQMDAVRRGRAITLQYMTPLERFVKAQMQLREHFRAGRIGLDTFNRGIEDITKNLEDAQKKSKIRIDFQVTGLQAIAKGSVAAAVMTRNLQHMIAGAGGRPQPLPGAGPQQGIGFKPGETGMALGNAFKDVLTDNVEDAKTVLAEVFREAFQAAGLK
jgi:hypothetical protein